jgi:hypothetical protein
LKYKLKTQWRILAGETLNLKSATIMEHVSTGINQRSQVLIMQTRGLTKLVTDFSLFTRILSLSYFSIPICFCSLTTSGQSITNKSLLDSAINYEGAMFVNAKPISKIQLEKSEMWNYISWYKDFEKNGDLDTLVVLQIINNIKFIDTTS